ncbi:hypothetical protein [Marinoscillum luteum]|uniref:J domain-containing protein n=1 Tax=Marinoscillum luteum TaxID=861051 RepID=A0ABW7NA52_9BACT
MNLRAYLISKKIDPDRLKSNESDLYKSFNIIFSQMHPDSFTAQKLFLINKLRRKYRLEKEPEENIVKQVKKVKPKIVPRLK